MSDNPLLKYNTKPGIYIKLPSGGKYYENPPKLTADGDIEILQMNAIDELNYQNPDGLLNNDSLVKVFTNTIPSIPNPEEITKPDLDVLLVGIRMSTYGKEMDLDTKCEKCENENRYSVNLLQMLGTIKDMESPDSIEIGELKVNIKPYTLMSQNNMNNLMIGMLRIAKELERRSEGNETDDELMEKLNTEMSELVEKRATELFKIASDSIRSVETPDESLIEDREFINEWLKKISAPDYKKIRDAIVDLSESVIDTNFTYVCQKCETENTMEVDFDPANFSDNN